MTQLSATTTVPRLVLHRETVLSLMGGHSAGDGRPAQGRGMSPVSARWTCFCTWTCKKECPNTHGKACP